MRLFVLNTDYVWRYKYKNDKHLEPNDRFEFEMCILTKNFELIILTHFDPVLNDQFLIKIAVVFTAMMPKLAFLTVDYRNGQTRYCGGQGHEFFIENFVKIAQKFQK